MKRILFSFLTISLLGSLLTFGNLSYATDDHISELELQLSQQYSVDIEEVYKNVGYESNITSINAPSDLVSDKNLITPSNNLIEVGEGSTSLSYVPLSYIRSVGKTTGKFISCVNTVQTSVFREGVLVRSSDRKTSLGKLTATAEAEVTPNINISGVEYEGFSVHTSTYMNNLYQGTTGEKRIIIQSLDKE